jgi:hypothetical protein
MNTVCGTVRRSSPFVPGLLSASTRYAPSDPIVISTPDPKNRHSLGNTPDDTRDGDIPDGRERRGLEATVRL